MEGGHDTPFATAFGAWFAVAVDLHDTMAFATGEDRDSIEINFLVGDGALRGYAHKEGISVAAMLDGECWDFMFDEDLVAVNDGADWVCSLCPSSHRRLFSSIEALWIDHLFEPLRRWGNEKLRPAISLEFHRQGDATWARLRNERHPIEKDCTVIRL